MRIEVRRQWFTDVSTISEVYLDSQFLCYGLEPAKKEDGSKPRAIPAGTYDLTIRWSPRFNRLMPHVESVPGFDGVLVHWGNWPRDTEGCLLLGCQKQLDAVLSSKAAFDVFWAKLQEAHDQGPITISYTEQPQIAPDVSGEISV